MSMKLYIRFGEIPKDERSAIHFSDEIVGYECGVSVWDCIEADGRYYPILPKEPNENAISDYFHHLLHSNKKVYLVTGDRIRLEGHDREPLLRNVIILKDITWCYNRPSESDAYNTNT